MLNKTMIAMTAAFVLGSASAALAYEAPENKIGDRYPFLEQTYTPVSAHSLGSRNLMRRQVSYVGQYANEAPENKIDDRYPLLEKFAEPVTASGFAGRYLTSRLAINSSQYAYEAPENRIGDKYPLLEQRVQSQRGPTRYLAARGTLTTGSIR